MFLFRKKNSAAVTDLGWLATDIHSHLLPGIDDGAPDTAVSLELISGLSALGFKKIITTPHVLWEVYPNTTETIRLKHEPLKAAIREANINVEFSAAAEYFIDEHFVQLLVEKTPLLALQNNIVLVEFSMITAPMELLDVLFQMQLAGYQPLIAHPERYIYLQNRKAFFNELKAAGSLFQLNLLSLTTYYGTSVQTLADYLLNQNLYDYAGTDLHSQKQLQALQNLAASPLYERLKESPHLKNHLL